MEIKREAGQVVPPPFLSPLGESGQSDGGRLAGRVLACLYNPGNLKKVPEKPKKVTKITMEISACRLVRRLCHEPHTSAPITYCVFCKLGAYPRPRARSPRDSI